MLSSFSYIGVPFLSEDECDAAIEYSISKFEQLRADEAGYQSLLTTEKYDEYNFFNENRHLVERLSSVIATSLPWLARPLLIQSWVNIYREGEGIKWHSHCGTTNHSYTANIFLGGPTAPGLMVSEPGMGEMIIENKRGVMLIMNCNLFHHVPPNVSGSDRFTVGMTIHDFFAIKQNDLAAAAINGVQSAIILA